MNGLKMSKRYSKVVNGRIDNTMNKRKGQKDKPNLLLSLRFKGSGCHYNSIYNNTGTK
jgi:hypothetical protein